MTYLCSKCGRTFLCEETISFCPFCGTAYSPAAAPQVPSSVRIVIGSSSERTVQEKHWHLARGTICQAISTLSSLIPNKQDCTPRSLDLNQWLCQQKRCRSTTQFKQQCDAFLERISFLLHNTGAEADKQPSTDVDQLRDRIQCTCSRLLDALQPRVQPDEYPTLNYTPTAIQKKSPGTQPHVHKAYFQLLKAVKEAKPILYAIFDENGVFVALSVLESISPESAAAHEPSDLSVQLYAQARKDYDPLFGEEYDEFVQTFWEAMMQLADVVNRVQALSEQDDDDLAMIDALTHYLDAWSNLLDVTLDELYQSQQADMVHVHLHLQQLCSQLGMPL